MSADIIKFPRPFKNPELLSAQAKRLKKEAEKYGKQQLQEKADMITDTLMIELADEIDANEIPTTNETFERDYALVWYALQATIYRYYGFKHDLHNYMNAAVKNDKTGTWDHNIFKVKKMKVKKSETANTGNTKIAATGGKE